MIVVDWLHGVVRVCLWTELIERRPRQSAARLFKLLNEKWRTFKAKTGKEDILRDVI